MSNSIMQGEPIAPCSAKKVRKCKDEMEGGRGEGERMEGRI